MKNKLVITAALFSIFISLGVSAGGEVTSPLGRRIGEKAWGTATWLRGKGFEERLQLDSGNRLHEAFEKFSRKLAFLQTRKSPSNLKRETTDHAFAEALIKCSDEMIRFVVTNENNPEDKCKANVKERGFAGLGTMGGLPVVKGICQTECLAKIINILTGLIYQRKYYPQRISTHSIFNTFIRELYETHQCSPRVSTLLLQSITPPDMYNLLPHNIQPIERQKQLLVPICQELYQAIQ